MRKRIDRGRKKTVRRIFLVICEGETEEAYVKALKHYYRLPIIIKPKVVGNKITKRLISQYVKEEGLEKKDECNIFYMYDGDIDAIVTRLKNLEGTLLLTTPCIELWFLWHMRDFWVSTNANDMLKHLQMASSEWQTYEKGKLSHVQIQTLITNKEMACERSQRKMECVNPASTLHKLISILEEERSKLKNNEMT